MSADVTGHHLVGYSVDSAGTFEAKTHLSRLRERVAAGEQVAITRYGPSVARLVPVMPPGVQEIRETVVKLKKFSEDQSVGGLKIEDLINEGRR